MGKFVKLFKKQPDAQMNEEINLALRDLAGWPMVTEQTGGYKARCRTITIQRDALGRVTGSVEQIHEDEFEDHSEFRGR